MGHGDSPADRLASSKEGRRRGRGKKALWVVELRAQREARGLTLKDVAEAVRISIAYLSALELGHAEPSLSVAYRLALFYGSSVQHIWIRPTA